MTDYEDFKKRFSLLAKKRRDIIINTLSNIFTMRLVGNKTHGDLAEIGMTEFINQFMYDFKSRHIGKERFRAKEHEEDILIISEIKETEFPVSLKAYGVGPLQLSTDKSRVLFPFLKSQGKDINDNKKIRSIFKSKEFKASFSVNTMPLIYNEKNKKCNIMAFDYKKAIEKTNRIIFIDKNKRFDSIKNKVVKTKGRKHPIFLFIDSDKRYVCEVRYGGATANALQRGLWTHTIYAESYFDSLTGGWIDYSHREGLVKLFGLALNSSDYGQQLASNILQKDIDELKVK